MAKTLGSELNEPLEPLDPVAAREERRATGRMCAVIVALLMIFSGFYHAWIKRIPVLAGVMVPALIMLLYAAWVLFLAKREKQRRMNAENHIRSSMTALSDILIMPPPLSSAALALAERRLSHSSERRLSHSSQDRMRLHPSAVELLILQQQHKQQLQQDQMAGRGPGRRGHRKERSKGHHHHHHHHSHSHSSHSSHTSHSNNRHHSGQSRRGSSATYAAAELQPLQPNKRRPSLVVTPPTPQPQTNPSLQPAIGPLAPQRFEPYGQQRPSLVRSLSAR